MSRSGIYYDRPYGLRCTSVDVLPEATAASHIAPLSSENPDGASKMKSVRFIGGVNEIEDQQRSKDM